MNPKNHQQLKAHQQQYQHQPLDKASWSVSTRTTSDINPRKHKQPLSLVMPSPCKSERQPPDIVIGRGVSEFRVKVSVKKVAENVDVGIIEQQTQEDASYDNSYVFGSANEV
jgi:hypothetical protein